MAVAAHVRLMLRLYFLKTRKHKPSRREVKRNVKMLMK